MVTNNKPANTMRCSNIKVTIFQNRSRKGLPLLISGPHRFAPYMAHHNQAVYSLPSSCSGVPLTPFMPRSGLADRRRRMHGASPLHKSRAGIRVQSGWPRQASLIGPLRAPGRSSRDCPAIEKVFARR